MLRQIGITGHNILSFMDEGWLFDHINEINMGLKDYKEEAFVDELFSNPKEIIVLLKLDYFHEFREYYKCIVSKIEDKNTK